MFAIPSINNNAFPALGSLKSKANESVPAPAIPLIKTCWARLSFFEVLKIVVNLLPILIAATGPLTAQVAGIKNERAWVTPWARAWRVFSALGRFQASSSKKPVACPTSSPILSGPIARCLPVSTIVFQTPSGSFDSILFCSETCASFLTCPLKELTASLSICCGLLCLLYSFKDFW